ncbi:MAG: DM13 domain-containing protein [Anaerolineae bacterium]|nr:DM13 domain-containing protein [Anaerolineae bacterium]MDK1081096.1 DM13 domain-containing protein [Anaerolineae bacterium]MDK1118376.1 DM13 domain-containing protein [Anaerolineae bacterium]
MKNQKLIIVGVIVAIIIAIPVGWYLLSPLWIDVEVQEDFPVVATPISIDPTQALEATKAMETALVEPTQPSVEDSMPAVELTVLAQGNFYPIAHASAGLATIYQLADGSRILRLQDFSVDNGPELHVYLVPIDPVPDSVGREIAGSVDLGSLKGNVGDQNYEISADLDLSQFKSVVIWCQPFRVAFSAALLVTQ